MPPAHVRDAPAKWTRVKALFRKTVDRDPADRQAILDRACGVGTELREAVEGLLVAHAAAADRGFLDAPLASFLPEEAPPPPSHIGPYRVVRELGRGGMGTVYLAEREEGGFPRAVAIKVVRRGMDTELVLRRFRAERQILATLEHPGIARLYDGGSTEDGRPYVVMEYVPGESLLDYCDARRLSVSGRLRLFQRVCNAVQYAHQSRVVHRDLKPSNILVTPEGHPKLLDFGIAKVLRPLGPEAAGAETITLIRLLTPEYASPEQLRGRAVSPASDVYALGVILYEVLCGHRPYRLTSFGLVEVERAILDQDPEAPSAAAGRTVRVEARTLTPEGVSAARETTPAQLRRLLRGDLDHIVLKALHKDAARRYATAAELAREIGRYLEGRPVQARPDGWTYRAAKLLRRQRVAVTASCVAALFTVVSLALAGAIVRPPEEEAAPPAAARRTSAAAHRLYLEARYFWNKRTGPGLRRSADLFQAAIAIDPGFAPAFAGLADAYALMPEYDDVPETEAYPAALAAARRALALDDTLAEAHGTMAFVHFWWERDLPAAEAGFRRALALDPGYATGHHWYGNVLLARGRTEEAVAQLRQALAADPLSLVIRTELGAALHHARRDDEAVRELRAALEMDPGFSLAHFWLARTLLQAGRTQEAVREYARARELTGDSPSMLGELAHALARAGRRAEARRCLNDLESHDRGHAVAYEKAIAYTGLGERGRALDALEHAFAERPTDLAFIGADPLFDTLREDPRFRDLQRRLQEPRRPTG